MEKNDNFIIQLRKGVFDLAILSLISKQPMYGYEITSALQDIPVFHIPNGSIYPILNRITKNNWAISYWEESGDGPKENTIELQMKGEKFYTIA